MGRLQEHPRCSNFRLGLGAVSIEWMKSLRATSGAGVFAFQGVLWCIAGLDSSFKSYGWVCGVALVCDTDHRRRVFLRVPAFQFAYCSGCFPPLLSCFWTGQGVSAGFPCRDLLLQNLVFALPFFGTVIFFTVVRGFAVNAVLGLASFKGRQEGLSSSR